MSAWRKQLLLLQTIANNWAAARSTSPLLGNDALFISVHVRADCEVKCTLMFLTVAGRCQDGKDVKDTVKRAFKGT